MPEHMLKFTTQSRKMPETRAVTERVSDFAEIYREFAVQEARAQSSRCSQCGIPFCQQHCPLGNNIPDWLSLMAAGRMQEAYENSAATNPMPEICGRICPQDRLCEGACVIEQSRHGGVTIGAVEKYITETAWKEGWVAPIHLGADSGQSVGIVGAGPAGLAAAEILRGFGHRVTIYDRYQEMGGLLLYGIPAFKLEKSVVRRRNDRLLQSGVEFRGGTDIGRDVSFAQLRQKHDAVLIATGVYQDRRITGFPTDLPGQVKALDFLIHANLAAPPIAKNKRVVVLGGGDTAMDCVRTAIRQGAQSVSCLYRRDRDNMPGSRVEILRAIEEGVVFEFLVAPTGLSSDASGQALQLQTERMRLGTPQADGRASISALPDSREIWQADLVISALGFDPEPLPQLWKLPDLKTRNNGTLRVNVTDSQTELDGVFAAGDIVRGASLVVWAMRDGREAAFGIHAYLRAKLRKQVPAKNAAPAGLAARAKALIAG